MIVNEAELRIMLGLASSITDEERAVIALLQPEAESKVIGHLGYDPTQRLRTEYYPRALPSGGSGRTSGVWDVNAAHTVARWESTVPAAMETLQLEALPIREVVEVRVDRNARFGDDSNAFGSGDIWTRGEDFWVEWDETQSDGIGVSRSGMLFASGTWPVEPGTVRVQYRAGYSPDELAGRASASAVVGDVVTTAGVNAAAIKRAVVLTVAKAMSTWAQLRKKRGAGWTAGPLLSENAQDYSYTTGNGTGIAGLVMSLPAEAEDCLEEFLNYGRMRL